MLVEFHLTRGYSSELDLFIAQTVLQYLCLKKSIAASTAFLVSIGCAILSVKNQCTCRHIQQSIQESGVARPTPILCSISSGSSFFQSRWIVLLNFSHGDHLYFSDKPEPLGLLDTLWEVQACNWEGPSVSGVFGQDWPGTWSVIWPKSISTPAFLWSASPSEAKTWRHVLWTFWSAVVRHERGGGRRAWSCWWTKHKWSRNKWHCRKQSKSQESTCNWRLGLD